MAGTEINLVYQSDQTLDSPRVKTKVALKTLDGDRALNLTFAAPAGADRAINFPDPTADDTAVYANLAQTLNNKTLGAGIVLPDVPNYAHLLGQAGGQTLKGGTGAGEDLSLESTNNGAKGNIRVKDPIIMTAAKGITVSGGSELTGLPATPVGGTSATSKTYVDAAIASAVAGGSTWREPLLSVNQLDSTNNAVAQAAAFFFAGVPAVADTFIIKDGALTETFTVVGGAPAAFQYQNGGTAAAALTNLKTTINADSARWAAAVFTSLVSINNPCLVIWKKTPDEGAADRIYGVFATPANAKYINFTSATDYRSSTNANLPAVDPGTPGNFGIGRITANLIPNEVHPVRAEDALYFYNSDTTTWILPPASTTLATSASGGTAGGATIGQTAFDSMQGLVSAGNNTSVKIDANTIVFSGTGQLKTTLREEYLVSPVLGNISGTVSGDTVYPTFGVAANDFSMLYSLTSTAAGVATLDAAFQGRLASYQTKVDSILVGLILLSGAAQNVTLKVYVEGTAAAVVTSVVVPNGTYTETTLTLGATQPTGLGRFFVVAEGHFNAAASYGVGAPFARTE